MVFLQLGGYQVLKKWLSYREYALLGRDLTPDEVREVTAIARRLAALRLLEPALDAQYEAVKAAAASALIETHEMVSVSTLEIAA